MLNTALDESTNELVFRKYFNIGIADRDRRGAHGPGREGRRPKSVLDIARDIDRLADRRARRQGEARGPARGRRSPSRRSARRAASSRRPSSTSPRSAILGVHQMKQKPVVQDGQIVDRRRDAAVALVRPPHRRRARRRGVRVRGHRVPGEPRPPLARDDLIAGCAIAGQGPSSGLPAPHPGLPPAGAWGLVSSLSPVFLARARALRGPHPRRRSPRSQALPRRSGGGRSHRRDGRF